MKKALFVFLFILILGFGGMLLLLNSGDSPKPNLAALNDAVMSGGMTPAQILTEEYIGMNIEKDKRDTGLKIFLFVYTVTVAAAGFYLYIYCERSILLPFKKLRRFARDIAQGNLDIPLEMDKNNLFGAFTESFDLMREELKAARENERAANRSKKELVASLSHDIKTPVASIKAATELMLVSARDENDKIRLARINEKAEQINTLITDMFHATLEELQTLRVNVTEIHSTVIPNLIKSADYKGKVKPFEIPSCMILSDVIRLQQIFDNIIGNSYKYADTDIEIGTSFEGRYLAVDISDYGGSISDDELPLITNKFYRGKNADNKSGYGLGLFISSTLLAQMGGELKADNCGGRFSVRVMLKLAG